MKEELRKIRGITISTDIGDISLQETFREDDCEYDQLYFLTEHQSIIVKVYDLQKEESADRFHHQEQVYLSQVYDQLAQPLMIREIEIKKYPFGILALKVVKGSTLKQNSNCLNYNDWLSICQFGLSFIEKLRQQKQAYLNFHPSNIARNSLGEYQITDPQFLCNEGNYHDISSCQEQLIDLCQKEYLYRAPELLDQYCKGKIDYKSDIYSLGVVLYELIYHRYPFESKLAQINCNYRSFPDDSFFSSLISKMLKPYNQRQSLQNLKSLVEAERKKIPIQPSIKYLNSGSSTAQSKSGGIFSGISQMFSKLTTETESWYLSFTENDQSTPDEKYLTFMINKLYKKETKVDKLHVVMQKYLQQASFPVDQNRIIKTVIFLIQLIRKGPHLTNYSWSDLLDIVQQKAMGNPQITQLSRFCRLKIAFNAKYKAIFKGNLFIQDLSKFKLLTVQGLEEIHKYLNSVIQSIKTRFLFLKKEKQVFQYAKQIYCDEILDLISVLIFSILCIRKDNQLKLRKDSLEKISGIEKKVNGLLQKISYLSNHITHAIYSLESQYFYYQEEIQLRENPSFTSLEHFYKYSRQYKGLCVPQNYSLNYSSGDQKQFISHQNNRSDKSPEHKHKNYFVQDEDDQFQQPSFKNMPPKSPAQAEVKNKIVNILRDKPKKQPSPNPDFGFFQIKNTQESKQKKNIVTFDDFFKVQTKLQTVSSAISPMQSDNSPQLRVLPNRPVELKKQKSDDFAFFDDFIDQKNKKIRQIQKKEKTMEQNFNNFFQNFGIVKQTKKDNKNNKSSLVSSSSQKCIQENSLKLTDTKKSAIPISQPSKQTIKTQIDPKLLNDILSGLRLKELKQMIVNNQQVIIDFSKLVLDKVIGSGSAGEVYIGKYNNETLAIKKVKTKQNPNALKQFERELLTYIKIKKHPFLVSLVGLSKSGEDYYLLTEFCNAGSLFDLLHKKANTIPLSWKQRIALAIQIAKGMAALHQMKPPIIHRDLKSLNIFVIEEKGVFTAKVADFGLSRSPQAEMMTMYLGTLHWMAPQLLDNKQYSYRVDIYSFAIVLWEICSRKTPYNQLSSPMAIIKHVTMEQKRPNLSLIPPDCPPQLLQVMKDCWCQQANDRPLFNTIIDRLSKINMIF